MLVTVALASSMTATAFVPSSATKSRCPSGLTASAEGLDDT